LADRLAVASETSGPLRGAGGQPIGAARAPFCAANDPDGSEMAVL